MFRSVFAVAILFVSAELVDAQVQVPQVGTTVQLPTVSNFSINTVVSIPDGGTLTIGGAGSGISYSSRRPGVLSSSRRLTAPGVSVSPTLIIGSEVDAELNRRGRIALARKARPDIHGTKAIRARASFLARNLGRGIK